MFVSTSNITFSKRSFRDLTKNLVKNLTKPGQEYQEDPAIYFSVRDLAMKTSIIKQEICLE